MDKELLDRINSEISPDDSTAEEEKTILFNEIKKLKPKVVVETGTHRGSTTMWLIEAVRQNGVGHVYTADPYDWGQVGNFRKFPEHEPLVTFLPKRGDSIEVENIDFLFIDGYHQKSEVLSEMKHLFPKLSKKAVVFFHDTNGSNDACDVPGAIEEYGLKVEYLNTLNGMAKHIKHG